MTTRKDDLKAQNKFYTNPIAARTFIDFIESYVDLTGFDNIIEPSAGGGALLQVLPPRTVGVDLYPEASGIIRHDFLTWQPPAGKSIVIGNPPFGKSSKLAIDFFNRAAMFSEVIAFIVPVNWEKYSVHRKLTAGWGLIASERLPEDSFTLDGDPINVRCSMQIWARNLDGSKYTDQRRTEQETASHPDFDFVSSSDDWDFCMSSSPCIVRSKDYFNQRGGRFCSIFIKAKVPDLFETFNRISWQSAEGKAILGGSRFPVADQPSIVEIYSRFIAGQFPAKRGDWRRHKQAALVRKRHGVDSPEPIIIPYPICQNVPDPGLLYAA
ncbi:MAG: hypothetical protein ACRC2Y_04965 [Aeromonas veronii]